MNSQQLLSTVIQFADKTLEEYKTSHDFSDTRSMVLVSLFRKIVELSDGVWVCADHGLKSPADLNIRALIEAYLAFKYINEDSNLSTDRAIAYKIGYHKQQIEACDDSLQNPLFNDNKDFYKQANNLDEILLNWSDYEIASYITYYFGYWTAKNKKAELQRIRGLTFDVLVLGIARMKEIEESNDNSKIIPGFSAGLVLICTQASILYRNMNSPLLGAASAVFVAFIVYILLIKGIRNGSNLRSRAAKYRSLLEQVLSEKEKKK
ncbi:DUF5677 domain-containing protein [Bacillus spizizenii]|nr:DUF5677 domain-containing protein [Bacillus spizizenii]